MEEEEEEALDSDLLEKKMRRRGKVGSPFQIKIFPITA